MKKEISVTRLLMVVTSALLLLLVGAISVLSYHSLTLVIDRAQENLYHERALNIHSIIRQKYERLEKTGLPEVYKDDFQRQVLNQIEAVYGKNSDDENNIPVILNDDGKELYPSGKLKNANDLFYNYLKENKFESFFYKENNTKKWCHTISFKPWQWHICYIVPINIKYSDRTQFFATFIPIILILSGIVIILTTYVLKKIMLPVTELTNATAAIANGHLEVDISPKGVGELKRLASNFAYMQDSVRNKIVELKDKELNLRTTIDSISDSIIVTDSIGVILKVNSSAEALLHCDRIDLIGRQIYNILNIKNIHPDKKLTLVEFIKNASYFKFGTNASLSILNEKIIPVSGSGSPIMNEDNEFVGMVIVFRDISEEIQLREQLHQSQKMDAIGQLAGGVAHDFNNMLAGIIGAAEILKTSQGSDDITETIDIILNAADRAKYLTRQLLTFSRKGAKASSSINIDEVIQETIALLERTIDKSIELSFNSYAKKNFLIGDSTLLQNAFVNMGINSSHSMPSGGKLIYSTKNVELDRDYCNTSTFDLVPGEYIEVSIEDTGCGIHPDIQDRIFEPFFTTKQQGEGTGLGLAAVYGMVQEHGGAITVYSEFGKGTVFHIYLPVSSEEVYYDATNYEDIKKGSGTILVIDDEEIIRITAQLILTSLGYEVILAENGLEGLNIYKEKQNDIDMIILDMIMPVMGGREALAKIRELNDSIPILISSGFAKEEDLEDISNLGIAGFLNKPFRKLQLAEKISEILHA